MAIDSPVVFRTKRLAVRELDREDVPFIFACAGRKLNCAFIDRAPISMEQAGAFIERALADRIVEPRRRFSLGITLETTGEFLGTINIQLDESGQTGKVGYMLLMEHWHKGYASEALRGMLRFAFLGLELHRVYAECDDKNLASVHVLEAAGLRREGHFIKSSRQRIGGRESWRSIFHYAMLRTEYLMSLQDGDHSAVGPGED